MKNCPKCGAPVDDNARFCVTYGASLVPQMNNSYVQSNNHNKTLAAALSVVGIVFAFFFVAEAFSLIPYCDDRYDLWGCNIIGVIFYFCAAVGSAIAGCCLYSYFSHRR